jgi:uncharacterized membrane protein/cytochrome c553
VNFSDYLPDSWAQGHAAVTHFPIALLLVALFFDGGGLLLRRPLWREIGFALLGLAVLSMPFALLSGYLAGTAMPRPPSGFDTHWKAAVATALISAALWAWRWKTRPRGASEIGALVENPRTQWATLGVACICALAVGFTGHAGGDMFDAGPAPEPIVAAAPARSGDEAKLEKVAIAAGKMENAAGKLDIATDRLALASQNQPASKAAPASASAPPPGEVKVDASALDRAAQNMERVASRFETTAQKMEAIASRLSSREAAPGGAFPAQPAAGAPARSGSTTSVRVAGSKNPGAKAPAAQAPAASTSKPGATAAPAAPAAPTFDPALVALGAKKYQDEELGCVGCHKMNGKGGRGGPDLTFAGRLHPDVEWQYQHLKDPKSKVPGSTMPAYNDIPEADLRALATYMASLR